MKGMIMDNLGREHTEIDGYRFCLIKVIPFEQWIAQKYKSYESFMALNFKDKEVIFLRWKWGLSDEANRALEASERQTLHLLRDIKLEGLSPAYKFHFEKKLRFEEICEEVKRRIGLMRYSEEELPEEAQKALQIFEGEVV